MQFETKIRSISDFPEKGILFRDITTLLSDGPGYKAAIDQLATAVQELQPDLIVGPEARGFIIGAPVAYALGIGFAPVRKRGKLPWRTVAQEYALEYGVDQIEMHIDAIAPGQRVVICDDLLATGGTVEATVKLVEHLQGVVAGAAFLLELGDLNGRERLKNIPVISIVKY